MSNWDKTVLYLESTYNDVPGKFEEKRVIMSWDHSGQFCDPANIVSTTWKMNDRQLGESQCAVTMGNGKPLQKDSVEVWMSSMHSERGRQSAVEKSIWDQLWN